MYQRGVSGQYLFFDLVSVLSGFSVTGFSGAISGRKCVDGNAMALLSGNIVEVSGGLYRANLYDWDVSGNNIGFFFTASGCVPRTFMVITIDATSGHLWPGSGVPVNVYSGQLSGQPVAGLSGFIYHASGTNATVPIASISGVQPISGTFVSVPTASISGSFGTASLNSGQSVLVYSGQQSGQTAFDLYPWLDPVIEVGTTAGVGTINQATLDSGAIARDNWYVGSRIFLYGQTGSGLMRTIVGYTGSTRVATFDTPFDSSGAPKSGTPYAIWATNASVGLLSGQSVIATQATVTSINPGVITISDFASGVIGGNSGSIASVWGGSGSVQVGQNLDKSGYTATSLSGAFVVVPVATLSGVQPISGANVTVPVSSISGTWPASGANVVVPIATISGVNVVSTVSSGSLYLASGSIFMTTFASGVVGGGSGNLPSAWGASGAVIAALVQDKSGYTATSLSGANVVVPVASISGVWPASGANAVVPPATLSGVTVVVPVSTISGTWPASGATVVVPVATLSGVNAVVPVSTISGVAVASGATAVVPPSTLSGVFGTASLNSGQTVLVASGQLSGQVVSPYPWANPVVEVSVAQSGSSTTVVLDSGAVALDNWYVGNTVFLYGGVNGSGQLRTITSYVAATRTATVDRAWHASGVPSSGTPYSLLAADAAALASGLNVTVAVNLDKSGYTATSLSGAFAVVPPATLSGVNVTVPVASVSGITVVVPVATISGVWPASGANVVVPIATISGVNAVATATVQSGQVYLASGQAVALLSGQTALVYSGQLSGQPIAGLSGFVYPASGVNVTATASVASGSLYLASGSVFTTTFASGVLGASGGLLTVGANQATTFTALTVSGSLTVGGGVTVKQSASGQTAFTVVGNTFAGNGVDIVCGSNALGGMVVSGSLVVRGPVGDNAVNIFGGDNGGDALFLQGWGTAAGLSAQGGLSGGTGITATSDSASQGLALHLRGVGPSDAVLLEGGSSGGAGLRTLGGGLSGAGVLAQGAGSGAGVQAVGGGSGGPDIKGNIVGNLSGWVGSVLSGQTWPASGVNVVVPVSTISGTWPASGANAVVPPSTLSGVSPASGITVSVPVASISGTTVVVPLATLSGVSTASGLTVTVLPATLSGASVTAALYSGQSVLVYSGQLSGQQVTLTSGQSFIASGINVTAAVTLASGSVYIASGTPVVTEATISGSLYIASGTQVVVAVCQDKSGYVVSTISGQTYPASGAFVVAALLSGQSALVYSGQLSGQPVAGLSGFVFPASGANIVVPPATLSGVNAVVPPSTLSGVYNASGVNAVVPPATLSGVYPASGASVTATASVASGTLYLASGQSVSLNSGQTTLVYSGQLSGQPVTLLSGQSYVGGLTSGQVYLASGQQVGLLSGQQVLTYRGSLSGEQVTALTVLDKSGYTLSSSGLDTIQVESGLNFRQAASINTAALGGNLSGATTTTIRIAGAGVPGTQRITAAVDGSGNRTSVTLNAPT